MPSSTIGAQLYTVRDFMKTPADMRSTLKKIKQIGYEAVQGSGHGAIEPRELLAILNGEGLTLAATHIPLDRLEQDPQRVIDDHKLWGCSYTCLGGFFPPPTALFSDWLAFIDRFNRAAEKLKGSGLAIGYHNHNHELARMEGKTLLQTLLDKLSPEIWMEIDTYWITAGGGDPVQWIAKAAGRIPCVHLKDMAVRPDRTQIMAEVGEGNLNWPAILRQCRQSGVKWYLVEQDTCQRDPFESLAISLRNLREMGLS